MKKSKIAKVIGLFSLLILGIGSLAGCENQTTSEPNVKTTKKIIPTDQTNTATKSSDITNTESSSSTTTDQSKQNTQYGTAKLLKSKQWDRSVKQGPMLIQMIDMKIVKVSANEDQLNAAYFDDVTSPYYFLEFNISVQNTDNNRLILGGITAADIDNSELDQVIKVGSGVTWHASAPIEVNPGVTKKAKFQALLTASQVQSMKTLSLTFGEVNDEDYNKVTDESNPTKLNVD
jgi:hypothetical protein